MMATNEETSSESSSLGYNSISSTSESITTLLSDAGIYSLCGLTALAFHQLFSDDWDQPYKEATMESLIKHLGLPKQVQNTMNALMAGEGGDINAFVGLLKEENALKKSCLRVIEEMILFAVKDGVYDARTRVLILHIANYLDVPVQLVELFEESVIEMLSGEIPPETEQDALEKAKRQKMRKIKRYCMIGLAGLGGGAIIGLTGGLAAPLVAAGAGAIIGGAGAAVLGSTAGIAIIGSLFGMAGAGLTSYKMKKRVGDIEEFAFDILNVGRELHITIAISGWISEEGPQAFREPWLTLRNTGEQFSLRYESAYLLELGRALEYFLSIAVSMAAQEALKHTILSGIMFAIAWPTTLITFASVIDNPWGVCIRRSAEVGKHLADILLSRQQGRRPVSLIGFSLGARVIYYCLQELATRRGCEGIIQDVILLGAPVPGSPQNWKPFARVVSGKIINGYCRADWLLKFLYRTSSATFYPAGLGPIDWNDRRMCNYDLSDILGGHMDYYRKMHTVLETIGVRTKKPKIRPKSSIGMKKCFSDLPKSTLDKDNYRQCESLDAIEMAKFLPDIRLSISQPELNSLSQRCSVIQDDNNPDSNTIVTKSTLSSRSMSLESLSLGRFSRTCGILSPSPDKV